MSLCPEGHLDPPIAALYINILPANTSSASGVTITTNGGTGGGAGGTTFFEGS